MKRKADALIDTDSKRSSTEISPKEKIETAEQNAKDMKSIEYFSALVKLKGRLTSIMQMKEMTKTMKEIDSSSNQIPSISQDADLPSMIANEMSEDEWTDEEMNDVEDDTENEENSEETVDSDSS